MSVTVTLLPHMLMILWRRECGGGKRRGGGGGRGTLEVTGSNTVSDNNHACRNDGGEGRAERQSSVALDKLQ